MYVDVAARWYKVEFPSINRRDATGCPLSALGIASGTEPPHPTWCQMTTNSEMKRTLGLAFGSAILVLLAVGVLGYRGMVTAAESDGWVRHTHEVLENTQNLNVAVQSVESSYRGFALTGDPSYLDSYRSNISIAQQYLGIVRDLTVDNPEQQRRIPVLDKVIARKIQFGGTVIALRQTKGLEAAAETAGSGEGRRIMDEFQTVIRDFEGEEMRLLVLRQANTVRRLRQTKIGLVLGTVLGLLIALGAGWSVQRDQSARMVAEDARIESEERFRTLANNIPQLAWMANEKGYIFWYNDRWFDYTGTNLEQVKGWGWQKVQHPDHVKRVVEKITRCFQSGEVWEDTFPLRGRDGNYHLFLSRAVPIRDSKGKVLRWFGTNTDISETESSGAKYRGLLEAAPDAMVVVNTAGEIVLLNVRAEKQFGYHRDELVGQKVTNIIPVGFAERLIADDLRSAADALAQQIGTGIELIARRKDGSEFPIEIMLSPLESAEGILVTAAIRDISSRKKAEEHLLRNVDELNHSNEELAQFAYIASHHLQEPLRMVSSYTQLLSRRYKGKLDADADDFIAFAVDGADRMQRLIQDLLAYSRVETKGRDLLDTSSEEALQQALTNLRGAIEESGALVT